ncbi:hypothetical protein Ahy_A07g032777 [Arachis hypogaea]|uniref:Uncharacterized protein n=1 Tax=Arachis hypogaea TaxID=3818 RepID=A0A445C7L6_ARAHY|nr:hypothetical protein Ahy_A07g032777 [Arachis hypogaea]
MCIAVKLQMDVHGVSVLSSDRTSDIVIRGINAAYSPSKAGYEWYMDALRGLSREMADWTARFNKEQHCDSGRRFGHMIINLSECI